MLFAPLIGAVTLFASFAAGLPRPDSAIGGEVAVSAPNGIVMSDTAELASQLGTPTPAPDSTTSTTMDASTTTPPPDTTTSPYGGSYTTMTSSASYSSATYGSGNSNWGSGSSGYDGCVQQCVASFGAPAATFTPSPTYSGSSGNGGSGTIHTVIVAPTQGVLRYVPFAVNASIGDTVRFIWNANNHTVTKSSQLEICNKTSDAPFISGTQNKGFTFDQVVNDTNPTFFYCGTPTHCQKGMFGIINPPNAFGAPTSVGSMMSSVVANNSGLSAAYSYSSSKTQGSYAASNWGQNIDMSSMPSWSYQYVAENVLYARTFMAQNPDVINPDGSINMSVNAPLAFPADLSAANNAAASSSAPAAASSDASASTPVSSAAPEASSPAASANGATSTVLSRGVLTAVAIAATFLAL